MAPQLTPIAPDRFAGAPISWGVCEVPGWGHQLPAERVLTEMAALGLGATEFGPPGFMPVDSAERTRLLATHGLRPVGGFLVAVLHDPSHDPLPEIEEFAEECLATGAEVIVLAAGSGVEGYDDRPELDDVAWKCLLDNLDRIDDYAAERGLRAVLHPHVGTMVEAPEEIDRVVAGSGIGFCLDTGHFLAGGADPVRFAVNHAARVGHVHLKDVDVTRARRVNAGEVAFSDAVHDGLWRRLGDGDVDLPTILSALDGAGYAGWFVLEQDVMLDGEPPAPGPMADVRACLDYLLGTAR